MVDLPTGYWQELVQEWAAGPEPVLSTQYRLFVVGGDTMLPEVLNLWQQTLAEIRSSNQCLWTHRSDHHRNRVRDCIAT